MLGEGRRSNQFNRLIGQAQTLAVEKEDGDADKLVIVGFGLDGGGEKVGVFERRRRR